jgi:7-cyano-7-deazaguanine synthase
MDAVKGPSRPRGSVVLLSGGMDSATCLALASRDAPPVHALTVGYGQRHVREIRSARAVARHYRVARHTVLDLPLGPLLDSSLTRRARPLPRAGGRPSRIPSTYVPARNTIFLSYALAWAEVLGARDIFLGVNALDYSGYPDCRPEYIAAYQAMANLATRAGVEGARLTIHTPLITLSKREIIAMGLGLGVDYSITRSCYDPSPDGSACGGTISSASPCTSSTFGRERISRVSASAPTSAPE